MSLRYGLKSVLWHAFELFIHNDLGGGMSHWYSETPHLLVYMLKGDWKLTGMYSHTCNRIVNGHEMLIT